ncbi:MAG: T9SS type A sorting domain-containing protein, partial [Bacteroidota bacterium]
YYKVEMLSYYKGFPDLDQYTAFPPFEPSSHYTFKFEQIDVSVSTGPDQDEANAGLRIYPNPAVDGVVNMEFNLQQHNNLQVQVVDMTGRVAYTENVSRPAGEQRVELPVQGLTAGMYIVTVQGNEQTWHQQLIVR